MTHAVPLPSPLSPAPPLAVVRVQADREGLAQCLALVESVCARLTLAPGDAQAVHLAVEEACSNVVGHGYAGQTPGPLELTFHLVAPDVLQAEVADRAPPFHPDEAPEPDLLSDSDDRAIGGLGWFFIRQVMTEVDYLSTDQGNRLILRRKLAAPVSASSLGTP